MFNGEESKGLIKKGLKIKLKSEDENENEDFLEILDLFDFNNSETKPKDLGQIIKILNEGTMDLDEKKDGIRKLNFTIIRKE